MNIADIELARDYDWKSGKCGQVQVKPTKLNTWHLSFYAYFGSEDLPIDRKTVFEKLLMDGNDNIHKMHKVLLSKYFDLGPDRDEKFHIERCEIYLLGGSPFTGPGPTHPAGIHCLTYLKPESNLVPTSIEEAERTMEHLVNVPTKTYNGVFRFKDEIPDKYKEFIKTVCNSYMKIYNN